MMTEDDSNVTLKFTIGNEGEMRHSPTLGTGAISGGDGHRAIITLDDHSVLVFEASYENERPISMTRYSKGYLELRRESDDEVRLYNFTPESLQTSVAAHRIP